MGLRVVITDTDLGSTEIERRVLQDGLGDVDLVVGSCATEDDVIALAADADALIVQWAPVSARVMDHLTRCSLISRYGIGVDMIDVAAARAHGIAVRNVPHYCVEEVATHAVAALLTLWRRLPQLDASLRSGTWNAADVMRGVTRLSDATLGLVGLGRIGSAVGRAFAGLGAHVIAYDPYAGERSDVELVELPELAARADLISLHCPLTEQTRHLVDRAWLAHVKPTAVLVNTARGPLVDEDAVADALIRGALAGAALDVFAEEPLPLGHRLRQDVPNLLLSAHAAWCSAEALPALQAQAAHNVVEHFRTH